MKQAYIALCVIWVVIMYKISYTFTRRKNNRYFQSKGSYFIDATTFAEAYRIGIELKESIHRNDESIINRTVEVEYMGVA